MLKVKSSQYGITFFLKIFLNPNFQQLFQDSAKLFLKTNCAAMSLLPGASTGIIGF